MFLLPICLYSRTASIHVFFSSNACGSQGTQESFCAPANPSECKPVGQILREVSSSMERLLTHCKRNAILCSFERRMNNFQQPFSSLQPTFPNQSAKQRWKSENTMPKRYFPGTKRDRKKYNTGGKKGPRKKLVDNLNSGQIMCWIILILFLFILGCSLLFHYGVWLVGLLVAAIINLRSIWELNGVNGEVASETFSCHNSETWISNYFAYDSLKGIIRTELVLFQTKPSRLRFF